MGEKLSLQDLVEALANKAQITKKESELFFRELFQLILERIYDNDQVKIKDFGTFRLTLISSRESINVNTGEKIEIPSHFRLGFHPDKILKDLVNLPFSKYESIILEDGIDPSDIVFEEIEKETDISNNIVKKTIFDQKDMINEFRKKGKQEESSVKRALSKSFVYTYTESSKTKDESFVTIIVPKDDLIITESKNTKENSAEENLSSVHEDDLKDKEINDIPVVKIEDLEKDNRSQDNLEDIDIPADSIENIEKNFDEKNESLDEGIEFTETVLDISTYDESVVEFVDLNIFSTEDKVESENIVITNYEEKDLELNDDINFTESVLDTSALDEPTVELIDSTILQKEGDNDTEDQSNTNDKIREDDPLADELVLLNDPDRPLIPFLNDQDKEEKVISQDLGDVDFVSSNNEKQSNLYSTVENTIKLKDSEDMEKPNVDSNNEEMDNNIIQNKPKSALKLKLLKKLPVFIIVIMVLAFIIYSFVKLFDVKYEYERYLGTRNLITEDTILAIPSIYDLNVSTKDYTLEDTTVTSSSIMDNEEPTDSLKINVEPLDKSIIAMQSKSGVVLDGTNSNAGVDSSGYYINKNPKVISKKLNFSIVNKGQFFVEKNTKFENKNSVSINNSNKSTQNNITIISLDKGMTLRSLASKYYGNSIYWVYIYDANCSALPNPNTLSVNMKLVIPELAQYGIDDPVSQEAIKKAKQLEIKYL